MPTAYIKTLADKGKGTIDELESKWERAVDLAEEEGHGGNYAYITGIFNRMIGKRKKAYSQELGNMEITARMGQAGQKTPGYADKLLGGFEKLGKKGPNMLDGSFNMGNILDNGNGDGKQMPDITSQMRDPARKDLMPEEKTKEERDAERTADSSFGTSGYNFFK